MTKFYFGLLILLILTETNCSLLIGNIKPVEEKSKSYGVLNLSKENSDWIKLSSKTTMDLMSETESPESGISDVAYQSKKNASIISMNSACKSYPQKNKDLKELARELLLGISDITPIEERNIIVAHVPALETTLKGKIDHEEMAFKTVVLNRVNCVYDLMYIARPDRFKDHLDDFSRFVSSLRLK